MTSGRLRGLERERVSVAIIFLDEILDSNTSSIATHLEYLEFIATLPPYISLSSAETQFSLIL